jgi:transposase-like protein
MLIAGNYRCVQPHDMIPIREAVHGDVTKSREIYDWVARLCRRLGAGPEDLVPFEKYAKAAEGLGKPSSAARALFAGAEHIERVDSLVGRIARELGLHSETLHEIVALVDERLGRNRVARGAEVATA